MDHTTVEFEVKVACDILLTMVGKQTIERVTPSTFDFSGALELRSIPMNAPWESLSSHIEWVHPRAVFGFFPAKYQLDARAYEVVQAARIPYLSSSLGNLALACEIIRAMHVDLVVATRQESLILEAALSERGILVASWHVILAPDEANEAIPSGTVVRDVHAYPGKSL